MSGGVRNVISLHDIVRFSQEFYLKKDFPVPPHIYLADLIDLLMFHV